jgi:hypothetical protein
MTLTFGVMFVAAEEQVDSEPVPRQIYLDLPAAGGQAGSIRWKSPLTPCHHLHRPAHPRGTSLTVKISYAEDSSLEDL